MERTPIDFHDRIREFRKQGVQRVKLAITDIDGVLRGKYISIDKFESMVDTTGGFCDCVFGWDVNDTLYDNGTKFTGWHTAFPDAKFRIDGHTERMLPDENIPFYLADFVDEARPNNEHPVCPRNVFKRVLKSLHAEGLMAQLAFEYEFFLFNETPQTVREKNYQNLDPLTPGMFGYSIIRSSTYSELMNEFMDYCTDLKIPLEGLHCETGPGVWEAAIKYDNAMDAVDKASLFKTFSKVFFQKRGIMATFMARWSLDYPGQSGHIHQSLCSTKTDENLFYKKGTDNNMSDIMKHYIAGQVKYLKPFLAMAAPTINSYTRLVKGFWAPTASAWGIENRTTALRMIPGNSNSQRVEFRLGSADANPYLAAAAVLGAGLLGIQQKLELSDPVKGNAYDIQDQLAEEYQLPSSLKDSIENFKLSQEAKSVFGSEFVEHFVSSREWEIAEYNKAITDWQLRRYFEII